MEKKRRELGLPCLHQLTHGNEHFFKGVTMMLTLPWKKTASVGSLLGLYILSVIIFFPWRFVCIEEYLAAWCLHVHFGKYTALL